jgi:hypothetical protein
VLQQVKLSCTTESKTREIEGKLRGIPSRFCVIDDVADEYVSKLFYRVTTTMHYFSSIVFSIPQVYFTFSFFSCC